MTPEIAASIGPGRLRAAGAALAAAALLFLLAEFIAAAAWTDPPYSYTYHYISDLGVHGPLEALGQYMYSPLAWVMNTGFFLYGFLTLVGVHLLTGVDGRRRYGLLLLGTLVGVGGMILAFFHGDGIADSQGRLDLHGLGAMATIVGGNILLIVFGRRLGLSDRTARTLILLGAFGLVSMVVFLAVAGSGTNVLIGLAERCAVYPVLAGFIRVGFSLRSRRPHETAH